MEKETNPAPQEQENEQTPEQEQTPFQKFLDRLSVLHHTSQHPIRIWMAVLGVVLFIALVIAYYVVNGG